MVDISTTSGSPCRLRYAKNMSRHSERWMLLLMTSMIVTYQHVVHAFHIHNSRIRVDSSTATATTGLSASMREQQRNDRQNHTPRLQVQLHATVPGVKESESSSSSPSSSAQGPDMEAYASGYTTVFDELPYRICTPSMGSVPEDLVEGTYYRAGPAMFSAGSIVPPKTSIVKPKLPPVPDGTDMDRMVLHPFEGDGAVLGVTFTEDGKQVAARYRFVRTAGFTNERKKGLRIYTGMDTTRQQQPDQSSFGQLGNDLPLPLLRHHLQPGLNKNRKNTSNTRAVYWGKRLLSLWEGGQPYKLDGLACSTEGRSMLGGAIKKEVDPFGCKMVYDPIQNRALFYGIQHEAMRSSLTLYEFDSDFKLVGGTDVGRMNIELNGFALITDFAATDSYAVFVQPSISTNGMQYMLSKEPSKSLALDDKGTSSVVLVPRVNNKKQKKDVLKIPIPSDAFSDANLQFVNAYEDGDSVIFDAIRSDASSSNKQQQKGPLTWPWGKTLEEYQSMSTKKELWRYEINVRTQTASKQRLYGTHSMFGNVNQAYSTKKHQYVYMNVASTEDESIVAPPQGITKFNVETREADTWIPASYEFCGEPMFAPRKNTNGKEDDGYLLSVLYDGKRKESEFIILDAANVGNGPVTRIPLGIAIPHGLFGCYTTAPEAKWNTEKIERRSKLADKVESRGNMWNEVKSDFSGLGLRFDDMEEYFGDFFS